MQILSYIFWPRPPATGYDNPKIQLALFVCSTLVLATFALRYWRRRLRNSQTRKLSRSWASASMTFGLSGLLFAVARAEDISYVSMRFWWVLWFTLLVVYVVLQVRVFRARHYETLPKTVIEDPRDKYLPGKKGKRK